MYRSDLLPADDMSNYNFSVLLYDSRSGSTFLSSLLNQYSGIKMGLESAYPRIVIEYPKKSIYTLEEIGQILDILYTETQFQEMKIEREEFENRLKKLERPFDKKKVFFEIVKLFFDKSSSEAVKYTYVLKIPFIYHFLNALNSIIANYKIVHLIRDGRAVYSSKRNSISLRGEHFEQNLIVAALGWKKKIKLAGRASQPLINIRYEDLIDDTDSVLEYIMNFLEVDKNERLKIKNISDYAHAIGEKQKTFHTNVGKAPQRENIDKWLSDLNKTEIFLYEWINYEELKKYNYEIYEYDHKSMMKYARASLLYVYFVFHYLYDRTKKVYRAFLNGQHIMLLKRKLIQAGFLQPQ
jgi:hypothetical protein